MFKFFLLMGDNVLLVVQRNSKSTVNAGAMVYVDRVCGSMSL